MQEKKRQAVIVLSGGLDCISYAAFFQDWDLHAITFIYGQKTQSKEVKTAQMFVKKLPFIKSHKIIDISFMKELFGNVQLTSSKKKVKKKYDQSIIVPLRNAIFTTIASSYAYSNGYDAVILGSHLDDAKQNPNTMEPYFPDCTPEFFESIATSLHLGHFRLMDKVEILTPSTDGMTKSDVVASGYRLLGDIIFDSWSCYDKEDVQCGICLSCQIRRNAFKEAGIKDKTAYRSPGQESLSCVE